MPRPRKQTSPEQPAAGPSGAERLNALLATLRADPEVAPTAEYVSRLSDEAQVEAEIRGIRALARTLPHELGQPLSELLGYAELLRAGGYSPSEQDEILLQIERSAARLGQIVHALARLADDRLGKPRRYERGGRELVDLELPAAGAPPPAPGHLGELRESAAERLADS
jgi:signal transduction histidine kinase